MKKCLCVIVLLAGLTTTNSAFGVWLYDSCSVPVGSWAGTHTEGENTVLNWVDITSPSTHKETLPNGNEECRIKGSTTIVTLNTNENWTNTGTDAGRDRLRIYGGATLNVTGGQLTNVGWMRIGASSDGGGIGVINQSGGLYRLGVARDTVFDNGRFAIGDTVTAAGSLYTISGGTLTYDTTLTACRGQLFIGDRTGQGKMVVDGAGGTIRIKNLYIGCDGTSADNVGVLEFKVGSSGVSAIQLTGTTQMHSTAAAAGRSGSAELIITLTAAPPEGDIILVNNTTSMLATSVFNLINGVASGAEGSLVSASFDGITYYWNLTYKGGPDGKDIVLVVPEPATIALLSLGLLAIRRRK